MTTDSPPAQKGGLEARQTPSEAEHVLSVQNDSQNREDGKNSQENQEKSGYSNELFTGSSVPQSGTPSESHNSRSREESSHHDHNSAHGSGRPTSENLSLSSTSPNISPDPAHSPSSGEQPQAKPQELSLRRMNSEEFESAINAMMVEHSRRDVPLLKGQGSPRSRGTYNATHSRWGKKGAYGDTANVPKTDKRAVTNTMLNVKLPPAVSAWATSQHAIQAATRVGGPGGVTPYGRASANSGSFDLPGAFNDEYLNDYNPFDDFTATSWKEGRHLASEQDTHDSMGQPAPGSSEHELHSQPEQGQRVKDGGKSKSVTIKSSKKRTKNSTKKDSKISPYSTDQVKFMVRPPKPPSQQRGPILGVGKKWVGNPKKKPKRRTSQSTFHVTQIVQASRMNEWHGDIEGDFHLQHPVEENEIPTYDPIVDPHCPYVETKNFVKTVYKTRLGGRKGIDALTPREYREAGAAPELEDLIKQKEQNMNQHKKGGKSKSGKKKSKAGSKVSHSKQGHEAGKTAPPDAMAPPDADADYLRECAADNRRYDRCTPV